MRKWFLWKKENWKTYKYPLRKDKWQSSGAILPLPSTKIGRLSPPLLLNSGFLKDLNLFLYKYPLRKDRWQSSGAIPPLPLAKIGGLSSLPPPPPLEFRFSKGFEPVSLRYFSYFKLFPLFVCPTTRRVDFLEGYDCRLCLSLSVIRSVFKLIGNFSFMLSINCHVWIEHSSKKEMREVKSLNCSSNDGAGNSSVSVSSLPEIPGFTMVKMLLSINYLGQLKEKGKL